MKTSYVLAVAAILSGGMVSAALAQDAPHTPRYETYQAIAPSPQEQVTRPRSIDSAPFATSANVFHDEDAQRIRGDRW